jgi:hypothetical protein
MEIPGDGGKQSCNHERFRANDECAQGKQQDAHIHDHVLLSGSRSSM